MNTSISWAAPSLSSRTVEAGRGATAWVMRSTGRARLRLQVGAPVDPRDTREQVIHLGFRGRSEAGPRLALRAGDDHAALLQHVFAHRKAGAWLLLVADQRQMRVEQIMRGIAPGFFR